MAAALDAGRSMLTEPEGKALLKAYGIPAVETVVATDPAEAGRAAARLLGQHGACALKILSEDITHKSDVGGVRLGLASARETELAAVEMLERVRRLQPAARIRGFTVAPMIRRPRAHELIIGMTVDANFGPVLLFGAGGTAVEVIKDTAVALPPLDLKLARELVRQTRFYHLLEGYRDRPAADLDAITEAIVRSSALVTQHPEIRELDINPLVADEAGVIALDARVRIADAALEPRPQMAIRPYPAECERAVELPHIGRLLIRPIRPEDERLYDAFWERLTPEDVRLRLFAPIRRLSHKFLARLTQIDYAREMAFVAVVEVTGELLGVSRLIADPDYTRAEFAVLVRSDLKGRGLGWQLMRHLIDYAASEGLKELFGDVLAENASMLQMCRELGFRIEAVPRDWTLRKVTLDLAAMPANPSA
jgi:acetyltransferase